jgi:hypothetical protein
MTILQDRRPPTAPLVLLTLVLGVTACGRSCPASGWLLMEPPVVEREGQYTVSSRASVHFWDQREAFDTAAACEDMRRSRSGEDEPSLGEAPPPKDAAGAQTMKLTFSRCVPTGAVYQESGERKGRGKRASSPP